MSRFAALQGRAAPSPAAADAPRDAEKAVSIPNVRVAAPAKPEPASPAKSASRQLDARVRIHRMLIEEIERATNNKLSKAFKERYIKGADELTLVRSGLDDTMRGAYSSMRDTWHAKRQDDPDFDLRTAAYMIAIQRVADSYTALGL